MEKNKFDLVVIGGGPGGYVSAIRASQLGMKVACIDKRGVLGGTCLNVGCIPSKTLLHLSHDYYEVKNNMADNGIICKDVQLDLARVHTKRKQIISELTKGIAGLFKKNKILAIKGEATIVKLGEIVVNQESGKQETIYCDKILIATGSKPSSLPNINIDEKTILSSTGCLNLETAPKTMAVIGGGVIGLELGSVWSRFGSKVEVIEYFERICPVADKEISQSFKSILEKQGIKFSLNTELESIENVKNGAVITLKNQKTNKTEKKEFDKILMAVGRKPNTESLGLENVAIQLDKRGFIQVNDKFETSAVGIYAIGDVIPGPMLAHKAEEEGVICAEMMAGQSGHIDYNLIASVIYTSPEVAWVGQTEEELKEKKINYKVGKFPFMANSRAKATLSTEGFVKILACKDTDKILGCHIIGQDAGNLIHEVVVAMEFGGSAEDIARTCHAHPTFNEAIKEASLAVDKRTINM